MRAVGKIAVGKKAFQYWLQRRIPRQKTHRLQHRNIFILPSKVGMGFLLLVGLLWLLGTNYQNNLVLSVAFLLLSLMLVGIHHTYGNLAGLQLTIVNTEPGFVGEQGRVRLLVKKHNNRQYEAIHLGWPGGSRAIISLVDDEQISVGLSLPLKQRGWYQPPRLRVATHFPLGLMVAWSYLDLEAAILAYPQPIASSLQARPDRADYQQNKHSQDSKPQNNRPPPTLNQVVDSAELLGVREYQSGDPLRRIDWRALARGQGMATRLYGEDEQGQALQEHWLDWQQLEGLSREARLSRLCACVLQYSDLSFQYGLRLPGQTIAPATGRAHQQNLLKALALFEWQQEGTDGG